MYGGLTVNTQILIDEGCPIRCDVDSSGEADFVLSYEQESLGIVMRVEALGEFLKVGGQALKEMDEMYARDHPEDTDEVE